MHALAQIVAWLNAAANAVGRVVLAPIALLPGWLSATLIAAVTGLLLLAAFKYTSNQQAIKRVRDDIKAHLLALKLFKDSPIVTLRAQGRVFRGAFQLMVLAIVPMLVMAVPVCLMLGQLALWYQARPLHEGEETLIALQLNGDPATALPEITLQPSEAFETTIGPVRVPSERAVYWNLRAKRAGHHVLQFKVVDATFEKELVIGDGFARTSLLRPGWNWSEMLLHPAEPPFRPECAVQSIAVQYPGRTSSWTSGADTWMAYWFVVSMIAAFLGKPFLNVNF
jgi:hypothetical protein